jgi:hypothetical protein
MIETKERRVLRILAARGGAPLRLDYEDPAKIEKTNFPLSRHEIDTLLRSLEKKGFVDGVLERLDGPIYSLTTRGWALMQEEGFTFTAEAPEAPFVHWPADQRAKRIGQLLFLQTIGLGVFIAAFVGVIASAKLDLRINPVLFVATVGFMLAALIMFNTALILLGSQLREPWVGWLAASVLLGPAGMLYVHFSVRNAIARHEHDAQQGTPADPPRSAGG